MIYYAKVIPNLFNPLRFFAVLCSLVAFFATAQAQSDEVYLLNGEGFKGRIVAIGEDVLIMRSGDRVDSISRANIHYVLTAKPKDRKAEYFSDSRSTRSTAFDTLDRVYMFEVGGGLYTFSNFALSLHSIHWVRFSSEWSLGVLGALEFSRFVMLRFGVQGKRTFSLGLRHKPYFVCGVAVGPWAGTFIDVNSFSRVGSEFSPILQGNIGGGLWYDTTFKMALTAEGGLSYYQFSYDEEVFVGNGTRVTRNNVTNLGPYFRLGLVF